MTNVHLGSFEVGLDTAEPPNIRLCVLRRVMPPLPTRALTSRWSMSSSHGPGRRAE